MLISSTLFLAGLVKGGLGFGLPLVGIPFLTIFLSVEHALAIMTMPLVTTNLRLAFAGKNLSRTLVNYRLLIAFMVVGTFLGVNFLAHVDKNTIYILLGFIILLFSFTGKASIPQIPHPREGALKAAIGLSAGLVGGISSAFGPLIVMYFRTLNLEKDEFVSSVCLMLLIGTATLAVFLQAFAVSSLDLFILSAVACIPTFAGLYAGEVIRSRVNTERFYQSLLILLIILGVNLLSKGLMGKFMI